MPLVVRPAVVPALVRSSPPPVAQSRPKSSGGELGQDPKPVASWGAASPSTTRNWLARGSRPPATTGAAKAASEYASKNVRLYASGRSPPPWAVIVAIAAEKV